MLFDNWGFFHVTFEILVLLFFIVWYASKGLGVAELSRTQRQTQRKTTKALKIGDKKNLSIVLNQGKKSLLK